jgi:two-component system, NarL family, sensor histidine kinase UhpB
MDAQHGAEFATPDSLLRQTSGTDSGRSRPRSLLWRLFLVNVSVLVVAALLLALTPVTISAPVHLTELLVLAAGLVVMAFTNLLLLRRALSPLSQLTSVMESVDPLEPGRRLTGVAVRDAEVATLTAAFNSMLDRLELERRESAQRALAAQEGERLRVARELHDEIGQTLTAIGIEVERAAGADSLADTESWERIARWTQQAIDDLRRIARELRPEALDDLGLVNAFIALCNRVADQSSIRVDRQLPDRLPPHDLDLDLVIYRVAQESLTNVMRHSAASHATVSLSVHGDRIVLVVSDNGIGIADGTPAESKSGLAGMRERAMLVGGTLEIRSSPDKGTAVRLEVPLNSCPSR